MDIRNILLFAAAADYTKNGHLTALEWAKGKMTGHGRDSKYDDPKMRNRVLRAQASAAEQKEARKVERADMMASAYERLREFARSKTEGSDRSVPAGSAAPSGHGHWVRKGDSEDARLQRMLMRDWKRTTVIDMLRDTSRKQTRHRVTDRLGIDASRMPVAYEWLAAVAWFHLSDTPYDVRSSMNLVLDEDMKPMRCAPGGEGDVVIRYRDCVVLIEATLMNLDNQRRNEWEPAMRHAANLEAETGLPVYTIFLAPDIDDNTANVWRAVSRVPYTARNGRKVQVRILPLKSDELAEMLERGVRASTVIDVIRDVYAEDMDACSGFDGDWRNEAVGGV